MGGGVAEFVTSAAANKKRPYSKFPPFDSNYLNRYNSYNP